MNREAWLQAAAVKLRPLLKPYAQTPDVMISVGWARNRPNTAAGTCTPSTSAGGIPQIFIWPAEVKVTNILSYLLHELIHASDDCDSGHKGHFARVHKAVGFVSPPTLSNTTPELEAKLEAIRDALPPYPHKPINLKSSAEKKQTTRMIKIECKAANCHVRDGESNYSVRTTQKWIDEGLPSCPCGEEMELS